MERIKVVRIGILTAGGDAPGMNALLLNLKLFLGVHCGDSPKWETIFFQNSYQGLVSNDQFLAHFDPSYRFQAGSFLGSIRYPQFQVVDQQLEAVQVIRKLGLDLLIIIGGNGTYQGVQKLRARGVKIIFVPATIDNDLPYPTEALGYPSALQEVVQDLQKLAWTFRTSRVVGLVEVMGRQCNDLILGAAEACGLGIVLPDQKHYPSLHQIAEGILAEWHQNGSALLAIREHYLPDGVQSREAMVQKLESETHLAVRWTTLGHLQRGASPVAQDLTRAWRVAELIAEQLQIGQWNFDVLIQGERVKVDSAPVCEWTEATAQIFGRDRRLEKFNALPHHSCHQQPKKTEGGSK